MDSHVSFSQCCIFVARDHICMFLLLFDSCFSFRKIHTWLHSSHRCLTINNIFQQLKASSFKLHSLRTCFCLILVSLLERYDVHIFLSALFSPLLFFHGFAINLCLWHQDDSRSSVFFPTTDLRRDEWMFLLKIFWKFIEQKISCHFSTKTTQDPYFF